MRLDMKIWGMAVVGLLLFIFFVEDSYGFQETEKSINQFYPAIYEDIIVWEDDRNGNLDIYGYNLSTEQEFQITTNETDQLYPAISNNVVVWMDFRNGNWDIYGRKLQWDDKNGYDLSREEKEGKKEEGFPITTAPKNQRSPAIYGNLVVWEDNRYGDWDIYGYDLSTGQEFCITTSPADQRAPAIYGNLVIWEDNRNGNLDIYGHDLSGSREFRVTINQSDQRLPTIWGYTIVWMDFRNGNWDIYGRKLQWDDKNGYDLSREEKEGKKEEGFPIVTNQNDQRSPVISDNIVVWYDDRNRYDHVYGDFDIYGYDLSKFLEFRITKSQYDQKFPAIYDNIVVWMHKGDSSWSCYSHDLSAKEELPITMPMSATPPSPFPDQRLYPLYVGVLLAFVTMVLLVHGIARGYPELAFGREFITPPSEELKESKVRKVNALKDPISRFLFSRWEIFFGILLLFLFLLILTSFSYGSLIEIDIDSLPRENVALLREEAIFRPTSREVGLLLDFLVPTMVFILARDFFLYFFRVFGTIFQNGVIKRKQGSTSIKVLDDFNESLRKFEKEINGKKIYVPGFLLCSLRFLDYFRDIQSQNLWVVDWTSFSFYPGNSIMYIVITQAMFFIFGIVVCKMYCVGRFMRRLKRQYEFVLKPYDADGLGGFQPFEQLWLKMSLMAIPVVAISVVEFLLDHYFGTGFSPFSSLVICNIVVASLLAYPILNYYDLVETQKNNLLEKIERNVNKHYGKIEETLFEEKENLDKHRVEQIDKFQKIALKVNSIPSLPFKTYQKIYIFLSAITPWIIWIITHFT